MNHPKPEEWLLYLDGEAAPVVIRGLRAHLKQCPQCTAEMLAWRQTIQKLRRLPSPHCVSGYQSAASSMRWRLPVLRWGVAFLAVALTSFVFGRLSSPNLAELKESVAKQVKADVRETIKTDLLASFGSEMHQKTSFQKDLGEAILRSSANQATAKAYVQELFSFLQKQRDQDQRAILDMIQGVRDLHVTDTLALRQDLETAVSVADRDLRQNKNQIDHLTQTVLTAQK